MLQYPAPTFMNDARADPRRLLPRTGVVGAFASFLDVPYEELSKVLWSGPAHPTLRRVMRLPMYAGGEHHA